MATIKVFLNRFPYTLDAIPVYRPTLCV